MATESHPLDTVVQAGSRVELLLALDGDDRTRAALEERTGIPRATVARNLKRLIEVGLVERRDERYGLTPLGGVVAAGIGELRAADPAGDSLDVSFLLRAESRVGVLWALESEALTRRGLIEATGIPRTTVRRTLADLRDRGVVRRDGHEYWLTDAGSRFVADLAALEGRVETMRRLGEIDAWLPTESVAFDPRTLADADVTLPDAADPMALVDRIYRRLLEADRFWMCSGSATPDTLEACWRALTTGRCEVVVSAELLDVIAMDTRGAGQPAGSLHADRLFLTDRPVDHHLAMADDVVLIRIHDDTGGVAAVVESEAPAVRAWVEGVRASFEAAREPVDPAAVFPRTHPASPVGGDPEVVAMIRRVYEDAWGGAKDLDLIDDYVGERFARHMPYNPDVFSAEEYKALIARYHHAFPDAQATVEDVIPQGDRYFFRWRGWGTHERPYGDSPPTGEVVEYVGMTMARFEDGKCVEEWAFASRASGMQ